MPRLVMFALRTAVILAAWLGTSASADPPASDTAKKRQDLGMTISCVRLVDSRQADWYEGSQIERSRQQHTLARRHAVADLLKVCEPARRPPIPMAGAIDSTAALPDVVLSGAGRVVVYVDLPSFDHATDRAKADSRTLRLYLNGHDQGTDAELVAVDRTKDLVRLEYSVSRGDQNKALWTALYQQGSISDEVQLRVGLGWTGISGATASAPEAYEQNLGVRVSGSTALALSNLWLLALVAGTLFVMARTDTFRDFPVPSFWQDAAHLKRQVTWAQLVNLSRARSSGLTTAEAVAQAIKATGWGASFTQAKLAAGAYHTAAQRALAGVDPAEEAVADTVIGLSLLNRPWRPVRATYSLARVQVGVWFVFVVATAVFLRVVYGNLPAIPATMLGLAGLSAATAMASIAVDTRSELRQYVASRGLLVDLVTDFRDKQQFHRFQSVVVNVLLLSLGVLEVVNGLAYPTFDGTWLALLGLSGTALAVGKELTETGSGSSTPGAGQTKQSTGPDAQVNPRAAHNGVANAPPPALSSAPSV